MALNFPNSPTNGDTYAAPNGVTYTYDGEKWVGQATTVVSLSAVDQHIIPDEDDTYDLGSPEKQWRDIFVAQGSIYIGDIKLSNDSGTLKVQQVTDAGTVDEEPMPDTPGAVTTDRLVNGEHRLTLLDDGTIELDGEPFTGGGGGSTGDIRFNNAYIYSVEGADIWIDPSNDEGDTGYIKVPGPENADSEPVVVENQMTGGVEIRSNNNTWEFNNEGYIDLPGDGKFGAINGAILGLSSQQDRPIFIEIIDTEGESPVVKQWEFNKDGSLTLPDGATITDSGFYAGPEQNAVLGQNDSNTQIYTQQSGIGLQAFNPEEGESGTYKTWTFGNDGDLVLPAGGDIKDSNGASVLGGGADLGDFTIDGATLESDSTTIKSLDGDLFLDADSDVIAKVRENGYLRVQELEDDEQSFELRPTAGELKFPDGTVQETAYTGSLTSDSDITITVGNTDYWAMVNRVDGNNGGQNGVEAQAVAYDSSNNVIMLHNRAVTGDSSDMLILSKFTNGGTLLWQQQFMIDVDSDKSHDIAINADDDIFVAVSYDDGPNDDDDLVIFKISGANGTILWQKEFHPNIPVQLTEGDFGMISFTVADTTYEGDPAQSVTVNLDYSYLGAGWTFRSTANGGASYTNLGTTIASIYDNITGHTTLYFAAGTFADLNLPEGDAYSATVTQSDSWIEIGSMVIHDTSIFVAGWYQENDASNYQGFLAKINAVTGALIYFRVFDFGGPTYVFGMEVMPSGDPVAVGYTNNESPDQAFVTKFDGLTGDAIWTQMIIDDVENKDYSGGDITIDSLNNIYAVINAQISTVQDGFNNIDRTVVYIVKLTGNSDVLWSRRVGPGPCATVATGIDTDSSGNIYLSALTYTGTDPNRSSQAVNNMRDVLAIAKYNSAGNVLWQRYVEAEGYRFRPDRDANNGPDYQHDYNRGRNLSVSDNGRIAVQVSAESTDLDDQYDGTNYNYSITFQIDQDGRTMTVGSGNDKFTVKESRIPGKFVELPFDLINEPPMANNTDIAEDVEEIASAFTVATGELAQILSVTEPYEYTFGNDGTLTIPNDGDLKLTQTQLGWISVFGPAHNDSDDIEVHGQYVDPDSGDVFMVGREELGSNEALIVKYNSQGQILWSISADPDSGSNRARAVKRHSVTGNICVLVEKYGEYTAAAVIEIDPDTARIVRELGIRDQGDNQDLYPMDFAFMTDGSIVIAGSKYDEWVKSSLQLSAGIGQSAYILTANIPAGLDDGWKVSGTGITGRSDIYLNRYSNITPTLQEGSGAQFQVVSAGGGLAYTSALATVPNKGINYLVGHKIKILGTDLGGVTPANDAIITVTEVGTGGSIEAVTVSGTAGPTYTINSVTDSFISRSYLIMYDVNAGWTSADLSGYTVTGPGSYSGTVTGASQDQGGGLWHIPVSPNIDQEFGNYVFTSNNMGGTYNSLTGTNYQTGSGFVIGTYDGPINYNESPTYNAGNLNFSSAGSNYVVGDVLTVPGSDLGGSTPANDMTITVTTISMGGGIANWTLSGSPQTANIKVTTDQAADFENVGTWFFERPVGEEAILVKLVDGDTIDWSKRISSGGEDDNGERYNSVAIDSSNNVYAAGVMRARDNLAGADLDGLEVAVVSKFNSAGAHQWTKVLNDTEENCEAYSVDVSGNYVAVSHRNSDTSKMVITRLDSTGTIKWQRSTNGNNDQSVAVESNGVIYASTQYFVNSGGYNDVIRLMKFTASGEPAWRKYIGAINYGIFGDTGRTLTVTGDHLYVSGLTSLWADDYDNGIMIKLPKSGDSDGTYGSVGIWEDLYDIEKVNTTEATAMTPNISTAEVETWTPTHDPDWFDPSDGSDQYHTLIEIRDRDGGAIEFADGTRQTRSAQLIPQTRVDNGADIQLSLEHMGGHIFVTNSDTDIIIPYSLNVPLPIGYTVVIINNTENPINIDAEGVNVNIRKAGDNNQYQYWNLAAYGMATLIKTENLGDRWYISGNVTDD